MVSYVSYASFGVLLGLALGFLHLHPGRPRLVRSYQPTLHFDLLSYRNA
jgi:hypothetical protein